MSIQTKEPHHDFFTTSLPNLVDSQPLIQVSQNQTSSLSLPSLISNSETLLYTAKDLSLALKIEENSFKSRLKDTEYLLSHEIQQTSQFYHNFEYLDRVLRRGNQGIEDDNCISEQVLRYLGDDLKELKVMLEETEKRLERFEERRRKSTKKT